MKIHDILLENSYREEVRILLANNRNSLTDYVFENTDELVGYDFSHARLTDVYFNGSTLSKCKFDRAVLKNVSFNFSRLTETSFHKTGIIDSYFVHCDFENARIDTTAARVNMKGSMFKNTRFHVLFTQSNFTDAWFHDAYLESSTFYECNFNDASFITNGKDKYASCPKNMEGCSFVGSIFNSIGFSSVSGKAQSCDFRKTHFVNCDFTFAFLKNCDLRETVFLECNIEKTRFKNCNLAGADLTNINCEDPYITFGTCVGLEHAKMTRNMRGYMHYQRREEQRAKRKLP